MTKEWTYKKMEAKLTIFGKKYPRKILKSDKVEWLYVEESWKERSIPGATPNDCFEWKGANHRQGYGMMQVRRNNDIVGHGLMNAQRLAAAIRENRPLKPDECVYSTCHNPSCTNPLHLRIGEKKEAMQNGKSREKWTDEWLDENLALLLYSTQGEVARELGLSRNQASNCKAKAKIYMERLERGLI